MVDQHDHATDQTHARVRHARTIILGFSCTQAFIYATFYLIAYKIDDDAAVPIARLDLLFVLAWMIVAFAVIYFFTRRGSGVFFGRAALVIYAIAPIAGVLVSLFLEASTPLLLLDGLLLGVPGAAMLCAWGRIIGKEPIERSVPEVFIASAFGGIVCFILAALPTEWASLVVCLLPILSIVCHLTETRSEGQNATSNVEVNMSDEASKLSGRILAGTCIYGLAAGLIETFGVIAAPSSSPAALFLLLFVLYCLAALQLFGNKPLASSRTILPDRNTASSGKDRGPLDGSYRLAVLLMMAGFLLVPVLNAFSLSEESVALSGYLGISTIMIALFLIMAYLSRRDATLSFARGFIVLFAGEVAGILIGNLIAAIPVQDAASITIPVAGVAVLCGYLFLFTGDDLRALSVAMEDADRFDEACALVAQQAGLSKREAEILPMALRGRTSDRISKELYITKNTVDTHMRRIYTKCNVHNRQELIDLCERVEHDLK